MFLSIIILKIFWQFKACLGSFVWSPDSTKIAYIAEVKDTLKEKCLFNAKLKNDKEDPINETNYEKVRHFYKLHQF